MSGDGPHRPVEESPEILADLRHRLEMDLDSRQLAGYAISIGLDPPDEPAGYTGWSIVEAFPDDDYDNPVLYWWGPDEDHADEP